MFGKSDVIPGRRLTLGITLTFDYADICEFVFVHTAGGIYVVRERHGL